MSDSEWRPPYQSSRPQPPFPPEKRKSWPRRHKVWSTVLGVFALFVVLIIITAIVSPPKQGRPQATVPASTTPAAVAATSSPSPAPPPAPAFTAAQQQAIDSAKSYLAMGQGFSKAGLMSQLTSASGEGFSHKLARFALAHIKVNWMRQAVLSAKGYLSMGEGFSYAGLVQQLESSSGEGFTHAQAVHGATVALR